MSVEKAEAIVADLENKRAACVQRGTELADERANVALAAHTGHAKAAKRLEEIHHAIVRHGSELASLDAALRAAGDRLVAAKAAEARSADATAAKELRSVLKEFLNHVRVLDDALSIVAAAGNDMRETLTRMHQLGAATPSYEQLDSLGARCLLTACAATPWRRHFEALPPNQRRSFTDTVSQWTAAIERNFVAPRLGENQKEEAA